MNSLRKVLLTLAGTVLVSAAVTSTWLTARAIVQELPSVGCEDLFNRLHPEWHWRTSKSWPPCFGLCNETSL